MFGNLAKDADPSNISQMDTDKQLDKGIEKYIIVELGRIKEAFDSVKWVGLLQPTPMVDDPMMPSKHTMKKRIVPESFKLNKTISGVKKIAKKPTEPSNLQKVQINILSKTIDKAIHNLSNLKISAMNMMEACLLEYNKNEKQKNVFADPVNAKAYLDNIPAFGQSLQNGIKGLKYLKDETLNNFTVEEIKDKICRIKAYMHATLNSYNHQHSVIKFGMGAPDEDYENSKTDKKEDDVHDAMDLVAGMMGIALEDGSGANTGGRIRRGHKGGFVGSFDFDTDENGIPKFKKSIPGFSDIDIDDKFKKLYTRVKKQYEETKETKETDPSSYFLNKLDFLLAEINICEKHTSSWPELEALYRYDVLDYTFAYARAQYGFNIGIQDEDGLYVRLIDDNSKDEKINRSLVPRPFHSARLPLLPNTEENNNNLIGVGNLRAKVRGGGTSDLTKEQRLAAIDSITRQTGIVDLPADIIQNIANFLSPYNAVMMKLAVKEVDTTSIFNQAIQTVVNTLKDTDAEKIKFYVYSKGSSWTLESLNPTTPINKLEDFLKPQNLQIFKSIVSVKFCNADDEIINRNSPDPARYIFRTALNTYVALLSKDN